MFDNLLIFSIKSSSSVLIILWPTYISRCAFLHLYSYIKQKLPKAIFLKVFKSTFQIVWPFANVFKTEQKKLAFSPIWLFIKEDWRYKKKTTLNQAIINAHKIIKRAWNFGCLKLETPKSPQICICLWTIILFLNFCCLCDEQYFWSSLLCNETESSWRRLSY